MFWYTQLLNLITVLYSMREELFDAERRILHVSTHLSRAHLRNRVTTLNPEKEAGILSTI
jgi:hypothetical protein